MSTNLTNSLLIAEAVYFLVKHDLKNATVDNKELVELLQLAGLHPSIEHFSSALKQTNGFKEFCEILQNENAMQDHDALNAFQVFDPLNRGTISATVLNRLLKQGNTFLKEKERKLLNLTQSGDLNYKTFLTEYKKTILQVQALALKKKETRPKGANEISPNQNDTLIYVDEKEQMPFTIERRGFFIFDHSTMSPVLMNHRYTFEIKKEQRVSISIRHMKGAFDTVTQCSVDTWLLLMNSSKKFIKHSAATNLSYDTVTSEIEADLQPDQYTIVPFTTQAIFKARSDDSNGQVEEKATIVKTDKNGVYNLSKEMRIVLMNLFDLCDLDGSGTLSREEFNLYNLRTGDEEVTDEEWSIIHEHFKTENKELSLRHFLTLHQMEAEDSKGDTEDMWLSLEALGCNSKLQLDEICPFSLQILSEEPVASFAVELIQPLSFNEWLSLTDYFSEQPISVADHLDNHVLFCYNSGGLLVLIIQNETSAKTQEELCLNVGESKNVLFNIEEEKEISGKVDVEIVAFAVPKNPNSPVELRAKLRISQCEN